MEQEEILTQLKKHLKVWRAAAWVLVLLFAAVATCLVLVLFQDGRKKDNKETGDTTPVVQNRFVVADAVKTANEYSNHDCIVKPARIMGYEYLSLSYANGLTIYLRNEYPPEGTDEGTDFPVLISNGSEFRECKNKITVENLKELSEQKPFVHGEGEYLFFTNSDGTYGFINMLTLDEAVNVNPKDLAASYFTLEDIGDDHVKVKAGGAEFVFHSANHTVSFEGFEVTDEEHMLNVSTPVCLGSGEYIGYLDATIVPSGDRFTLINAKFGAYVGFDYEDPQSTKIIEPIAAPIENPIVLTGSGRYYLPRFERVGTHSYNWDNLVIKENGFRYLTDDDGNVISRMGVDVSYYNNSNGAIDWAKVKKAGIDFAIVRIGYRGISQGTVDGDSYAKTNIQEAAAAGLDVGVYFYTQAITEEEAIEEADFVLKKIAEYGAENITLPLVIDTELYEPKQTARGNLLTREQRTKCIVAFCERVKAAGYTPMVYSSLRWSIMSYDRDAVADYPFWFAYYGERSSYRFDYAIWQYTSEGSVPGITGDVDLDMMLDYSVIKK